MVIFNSYVKLPEGKSTVGFLYSFAFIRYFFLTSIADAHIQELHGGTFYKNLPLQPLNHW